MDPRDDFERLIDEAEGLPHGVAKVALLEEAVRVADALRDPEAALAARMELTQAAQFGGRPDLALVSFSWCLAHYDRHADDLDPTLILWHFKWVVNGLAAYPEVPRVQIEALFADMTRRYKAHGSTLHAVHQIRREVAQAMFDTRRAKAAHKKFLTAPTDHLSNCQACVQDAGVSYALYAGDDGAAVAAAGPILKGKMSCAEVPHRTYAKLLLPHLRRGEVALAMRYHKVGYPLIQANPSFLEYQGQHLAFLALTGNHARAATLFNRHLPQALTHPDAAERFRFYCAAKLSHDLMNEVPRPPKIRVPREVHPDGAAGAVGAWLDNELHTLAERFDARNGNKGYRRDIAATQAQRRYQAKYPYRVAEAT